MKLQHSEWIFFIISLMAVPLPYVKIKSQLFGKVSFFLASFRVVCRSLISFVHRWIVTIF